jgi:hypothetical protein
MPTKIAHKKAPENSSGAIEMVSELTGESNWVEPEVRYLRRIENFRPAS